MSYIKSYTAASTFQSLWQPQRWTDKPLSSSAVLSNPTSIFHRHFLQFFFQLSSIGCASTQLSATSKVLPTKYSDESTDQTLRQIFVEVFCHKLLISAGQKEILPLSLHLSCFIQTHAATSSLIPHCNIPDPPTGEEDATMALTIWETSPVNMCIHKMMKQNALKQNIHGYNYLSYTTEATCIHMRIQHVHRIHYQ